MFDLRGNRKSWLAKLEFSKSQRKTEFREVRQSAGQKALSIFGIYVDFLCGVQGGFLLSKNPLSILLSVYTNSENALGETFGGKKCASSV
jgi:hypothetical protein